MPPQSHKFTLHQSWKYFFWSYFLAFFTIPLFGAGLILLYLLRKKRKSVVYTITDTQIIWADKKIEQHVDLPDISQVQLQQSSMHARLQVGTLILHSSTAGMKLRGIEQPGQIKKLLEQAIQAKKQQRKQQKSTSPSPQYDPGSMPKLDYLTGLWQQGLITDDDFETERKRLE